MTDNEKQAKNFETGQSVTVSRGTHKGKTGKIAGNAGEGKFAVQFDDGSFAVLNSSAIKEPAEKSITESALQEILRNTNDWTGEGLAEEINARTGMNLSWDTYQA